MVEPLPGENDDPADGEGEGRPASNSRGPQGSLAGSDSRLLLLALSVLGVTAITGGYGLQRRHSRTGLRGGPS